MLEGLVLMLRALHWLSPRFAVFVSLAILRRELICCFSLPARDCICEEKIKRNDCDEQYPSSRLSESARLASPPHCARPRQLVIAGALAIEIRKSWTEQACPPPQLCHLPSPST